MLDYLLLILQSGLSVFGIRAAYEQPAYDVIDRLPGGVEVREYAPRLAAETTVDAAPDPRAAQGEAFNRLAKYIFGANRRPTGERSEKVAMTTPVQTVPSGGGDGSGDGDRAKVAMTSPVQVDAGDGLTMRFFLPTKLTADTAPVPDDPRVRITTVTTETVAVLRFTGGWDRTVIDARRSALLATVDASPWRSTGPTFTLFYDPPFTLPFLRRNEVAVPVTRQSD